MTIASPLAIPTPRSSLDEWLGYWANLHVSAIDLGLERVLPIAQALQVVTPDAIVFTVAGTNGKGSTTATIASILHAASADTADRVGLYQSPHLFRFNERIQIDGHYVTDAQLIDAFVAVEQARQSCQLSLSFFEATTLAAFYIFKQHKCRIWVLEVGLGGRLDVVNLIDADVAVITNIGLDHTEWLGDTIERIAAEKAGIIRNRQPVIFAGQQPLPEAIKDQVQNQEAMLYCYGQDYFIHEGEQHWQLATPQLTLSFAYSPLAPINQAGAVMAILASSLHVSYAHIQKGIAQAWLPGRFQIVQHQQRLIILDAAHNGHGVAFFKQQLLRFLQQHSHIKQAVAVFSMLVDKDIDVVVANLLPVFKSWYIAPLQTARAAPIDRLKQALAHQDVHVAASVVESLRQALAQTTPDTVIVVCGSFHTLEAVWEYVFHGND